MDNSRRVVIGLMFAVMGITLLVGQRAILIPHRRDVQRTLEETQRERELLKLHQEIARTWPELQQYRQRLPDNAAPNWLMRKAAELAEASGVRLSTIDPQRSQALQEGMLVRVKLDFTCQFAQLGQFMSTLESHQQYIHVDELDVTSTEGQWDPKTQPIESAQVLVQAHMVLSTLYLPRLGP